MAHAHSLNGKTVLVTGGCGFVGSQLTRALSAAGVGDLRVIDDLRCGEPSNLNGLDVAIHRLTLGAASEGELAAALTGVDYLFHLAAETAAHPQTGEQGLLRANVLGTQDLYGSAAKAGVKKIVFVSTVSAYGRRAGPPMVETERPLPDTVYGASKLTGEHLTATVGRQHGVEWNVLRLFFVYGPRQVIASGGYSSVVIRTGRRLLEGKTPEVYGDGEQVFDYVYNEDVSAAALRALEAPISGEVFNVGTGIGVRIRDLIAQLSEIAGGELTPVFTQADGTAGTSRVADAGKIQRLLGWKAKTTLEEGLRRTYAWLREETSTQ
jgi:UDP-glucose 4-epimerase